MNVQHTISQTGPASCSCERRRHGWRSRWAAIGAAIAVVAGVGGVSWAGATNPQVVPSTISITPCRVMDTRPAPNTVGPRSTPLAGGSTHTIQVTGTNGNCQIPNDATSVLVNVTVVGPQANGFLTAFPSGATRPTAANINYTAGQSPVANLVNAALGADGQLSFFASGGPVNLVADISGYTTAARMTASQVAQNRWDNDRGRPANVDVIGSSEAQSGVAFDGTSIWVANPLRSRAMKVDVARNRLTASVDVGRDPFGVAFDGTSIWVTNSGSDNVSKINPDTNTVTATVNVGDAPQGLTFDGSSIWVANSGSDSLSKIDPATNTVTATVNVGDRPREIAFDGTNLWVTKLSGTVSKVNPTANIVTATVNVGATLIGVAFDGTSIWVTNFSGDTVLKIDPVTNSLTATVSVGDGPNGVAFDGTSIWVTNFFGGTVSKIDPVTNSLTATISVDLPRGIAFFPRGIAFDGTSIWVTTNGIVSKLRAS